MDKSFYIGNRQRFASSMRPGSVAVLFAGQEVRKTNDEYYPFFAQRNFVYLTGIQQKNTVLVICKDSDASVSHRLYIQPCLRKRAEKAGQTHPNRLHFFGF